MDMTKGELDVDDPTRAFLDPLQSGLWLLRVTGIPLSFGEGVVSERWRTVRCLMLPFLSLAGIQILQVVVFFPNGITWSKIYAIGLASGLSKWDLNSSFVYAIEAVASPVAYFVVYRGTAEKFNAFLELYSRYEHDFIYNSYTNIASKFKVL